MVDHLQLTYLNRGARVRLAHEALGEVGQRRNQTGVLRHAAADRALDARLLLEEGEELGGGAAARVVLALLVALREPLERREARHAELFAELAVLVGVEIGDDHVLADDRLRDLLIDGRERLAVAAANDEGM